MFVIQAKIGIPLHLFLLAGVLPGVDTLDSGVGALLDDVAAGAAAAGGAGVGVSVPRFVLFAGVADTAAEAGVAGAGVGVGVEGFF